MKKIFLVIAGLGVTSSAVLTNVKLTNQNPMASNMTYHQLYVLGDSLSDAGALVGAGSELLRAIGQNHGISLEAPFYQNRSFSNGQVAAEVLANKLNLTLAAGWSFNFLDGNHQKTGNNYAVGGAQALEIPADFNHLEGMLLNNFTIDKQVDALLQQHSLQSDDLIFFEIGSNDLMFQGLADTATEDQAQLIENIVSKQKQALEKLLLNGSKQLLVMNSPDLSKTPSFNTNKTAEAAELSAAYNQAWTIMISSLQAKYPHCLKVFDLYHLFPQLLADFAAQGGIINQGAVTYSFDAQSILDHGKIIPQWNGSATLATIDKYFFFDFVHPTAKVHASVGEMLYQVVDQAW